MKKTILFLFFFGILLLVTLFITTTSIADMTVLRPESYVGRYGKVDMVTTDPADFADDVYATQADQTGTGKIYGGWFTFTNGSLTYDISIDSVTVGFAGDTGSPGEDPYFIGINISGTEYASPSGRYITAEIPGYYNYTWTSNPGTSASWTVDDVKNLIAGWNWTDAGSADGDSVQEAYIWVNYTSIDYNVSTVTATEITNYSAVLNGSVNHDGVNVSCGFWVDTDDTVSGTSYLYNVTCINPEYYNASESFEYNITGLSNSTTYHYRAWGDQDGYFKSANDTLSFTTLPWDMAISCYNESNPDEGLTFDVFISNQSGSQVYEAIGCSNPHALSLTGFPTGENISFLVDAEGYSQRIFYEDIDPDDSYNFTAYLTPESSDEFYVIRVINELNDPVEDAFVTVNAYINESYDMVSERYTDANGEMQVYLVPGELYKINITANNYVSLISVNYVPDPTYYGMYYPKVFRMSFEEEDYTNETTYSSAITFNGYVSGGTLYVNFTDISEGTIDTTIFVFQTNYNTSAITQVTKWTETGNYDFQKSIVVNMSNDHQIVLYLNHSKFGFIKDTFFIPHRDRNITSTSRFNDLFDINYGTNPFGWSNVMGFILMVFLLFSFGQQNSGIALIIAGFILGGLNSVIGLNVIGVVIPALFVCLGILVTWSYHNRGG